MKKIIAMTTLITAAYAGEVCCEPTIHSSFNYTTIGLGPLPVPAPTFGIGRRIVIGEGGALDLGVEISTILIANAVKGYASMLVYFNQTPASQYYFGVGGVGGVLFGTLLYGSWGVSPPCAAPLVKIGKEYCGRKGRKKFFELEAGYPVFFFTGDRFSWGCGPEKYGERLDWGFVNLKYGIAF